jgi:histidyl-tRNA synthetase
VRLEINTLGSSEARAGYREALVSYLTPRRAQLDEDSQRRLERNPLRILDSKLPATQALLVDAPKLPAFVDPEGRRHFDGLRTILDRLQVPYVVNPGLVRGLDYYTHTVFEWITDDLGAQGTVCAGGRYDGLVERLGGRPTPGAGFALGLERVILLQQAVAADGETERSLGADVYLCVMEETHRAWALEVAQKLRDALPAFRIRTHAGGGKLRNQLKRADQSGARFAIVIGDDEAQVQRPALKDLRKDRPQESLDLAVLIERLAAAG